MAIFSELKIADFPGLCVASLSLWIFFTSHIWDVSGVIVLVSSACVCLSVCYHSQGRADKHALLAMKLYNVYMHVQYSLF